MGEQLSEFRKLVLDSEKIMFIGTSGFCTLFAELSAYVMRKGGNELGSILDTDLDNTNKIITI
ncbi:MAG: DUF2124 domain-containing protein [Methanosarcinaceae archaeon]|nr:DUF2124 domain-containing protein [Methanosarcinaceae archaeon]